MSVKEERYAKIVSCGNLYSLPTLLGNRLSASVQRRLGAAALSSPKRWQDPRPTAYFAFHGADCTKNLLVNSYLGSNEPETFLTEKLDKTLQQHMRKRNEPCPKRGKGTPRGTNEMWRQKSVEFGTTSISGKSDFGRTTRHGIS
ncbi:hypothetical protein EVAR_3537_1 [Eumeta japonica]|uniref:Uncharacterized protein n=1 Tax=Eumeta variegata TaxID=151549 RepID=A0A4C1SYU4_EUMVA|nr:hypothetical protein EVAR_3537_1 [Eumeta japonica]